MSISLKIIKCKEPLPEKRALLPLYCATPKPQGEKGSLISAVFSHTTCLLAEPVMQKIFDLNFLKCNWEYLQNYGTYMVSSVLTRTAT